MYSLCIVAILVFKRIIMHRAVVFVVFIVGALAADEEMAKCGKFFRPDTFQCCSAAAMEMKPVKQAFESELKECFDIPMHPHSCAREECIAKKKGYVASDGTLDKEAFGSLAQKDLGFDADQLALIKENCVKGDISMYGPPDMCDFMKMRHCLHIQLLKKCPEWSDKGECSGVKELFEECVMSA